MDSTKTPLLITLSTLLAALALALLGLAADNAAYYHSHQDSDVDVHYLRWNSSANAQYSYWVKLDYAPSNFSLSREYAEIATGVICAVVGIAVAVGAWFARGTKKASSSTEETTEANKKSSRFSSLFLPVTLALTTATFILTLALSIYTNQSAMAWPINFKNSLPLPPQVSNPSQEPPTTYKSPFAYTPEVWNCNLAPYVVSSKDSDVSGGRLGAVCSEAKGARWVMVPLVIISAFLVAGLAWSMWSSKKGGKEGKKGEVEMEDGKKAKEVDVESVTSAGSGSVAGSEKKGLGWSS